MVKSLKSKVGSDFESVEIALWEAVHINNELESVSALVDGDMHDHLVSNGLSVWIHSLKVQINL